MAEKIGFIGLGIMGKPMVRNLVKAGFEVVVHNRSQAAVDELTGGIGPVDGGEHRPRESPSGRRWSSRCCPIRPTSATSSSATDGLARRDAATATPDRHEHDRPRDGDRGQ